MSTYPITSRGGRHYLGNTNTKEVHDLHNEQTNCQIDAILQARNAVGFLPDTLGQAHHDGYDNCHYCIGDSKR